MINDVDAPEDGYRLGKQQFRVAPPYADGPKFARRSVAHTHPLVFQDALPAWFSLCPRCRFVVRTLASARRRGENRSALVVNNFTSWRSGPRNHALFLIRRR